jgi:putative endonuclease
MRSVSTVAAKPRRWTAAISRLRYLRARRSVSVAIAATVGIVGPRFSWVVGGPSRCKTFGVALPKRCVYVLRSLADPTRYYTGVTSNWRARLDDHNAGHSSYTSSWIPWRVDVLMYFIDEQRAVAFERYLKSGSGCAFAKRHLR